VGHEVVCKSLLVWTKVGRTQSPGDPPLLSHREDHVKSSLEFRSVWQVYSLQAAVVYYMGARTVFRSQRLRPGLA
jgi:hypothetical protein